MIHLTCTSYVLHCKHVIEYNIIICKRCKNVGVSSLQRQIHVLTNTHLQEFRIVQDINKLTQSRICKDLWQICICKFIKLNILVLSHDWLGCPFQQISSGWIRELSPGRVKNALYPVPGHSSLTFLTVSFFENILSPLDDVVFLKWNYNKSCHISKFLEYKY